MYICFILNKLSITCLSFERGGFKATLFLFQKFFISLCKFKKMIHSEDLLRVEKAKGNPLHREVLELRARIAFLKAQLEIYRSQIHDNYYDNK